MAISSYDKDGAVFWKVYVDIRSRKDRTLRVQRRVMGIETESAAQNEERKLTRELTERLAELEASGQKWEQVIDAWVRHHELYPTSKYVQTTVIDYVSLLKKWTTPWLERPASEITRKEARELLYAVKAQGKKHSFCKHLKSVINTIFTWGIDEGMIKGIREAPVYGVELEKEREETTPEILTIEQIRALLRKSREQGHPWYPIWVAAVFTGCRSGELQELKRQDIEIISLEEAEKQVGVPVYHRRYGLIRVRRNWNARLKTVGPTKSGYWRTVPISSELHRFLTQERNIESLGPDDYVLPHFSDWKSGYQAQILRGFCEANGLPSIRFHTLRACFATQLIATGVPATVVMKIAGWKDLKTMQRYVRLAGVDEAGATEGLSFIPTDPAVMEQLAVIVNGSKPK
ncbi:site-specific integrase [Bdellovibrionota bacterium FG-1]